ncbi:hypothetical protein Back11_46090 [Paenibacillus baekrokdamisoli]|uniref:Uncharacterized protein n=1 Tax=Paenibacillus baekrokdamisoli TaxID=1712516 RepID=A0A3G9JJV3_9BACL|nr:hypothetical protein [Paenibacillus baekrokdamisoli]MBB3072394.1 hypothetical protein [Paenibacillus baekrokdamisoli]BBH23264.1 hypothetical protein Back11_46090 [Paenibacillus baekrokdamisoli]
MEDGSDKTIWFEPRLVIPLWLGQAERIADKKPSEARWHPKGWMGWVVDGACLQVVEWLLASRLQAGLH